jgi:hypothetical protein
MAEYKLRCTEHPRTGEEHLTLADAETLQSPAGSDRARVEDPLDTARTHARQSAQRLDDLHLPHGRIVRGRLDQLGEIGLATSEAQLPFRADATCLSGTDQRAATGVVIEWRDGHAGGPSRLRGGRR